MRAALELRARLRAGAGGRLGLDLDHPPLLHCGFCATTRSPPGSIPSFTVADDVGARILQSEAFDNALERFLSEAGAVGSRRLDLLAAYSRRRLRELLLEAYERLRSAGRPLDLRPHAPPDLDAAADAARAAAAGVRQASRPPTLVGVPAIPAPTRPQLVDLTALQGAPQVGRVRDYDAGPPRPRAGGPRRRRRLRPGAAGRAPAGVRARYQELKDGRSLVDFNDLELRARRAAGALARPRDEYRERFAEVMVDEFQDTNRLQCALIDRVAGDRAVPGRRRVPEHLPVPPRRRGGVPRAPRGDAGAEVVALPRNYRSGRACAGDRERAVRARVRRPLRAAGRSRGARSAAAGRRPGGAAPDRQAQLRRRPGTSGATARCGWWPIASPS